MILTLSPSSIETLQECPTMHNFGSILRLRPIDENTAKMDRGSLFHEMLESHYNLIIANASLDEKIPYNEIILAVTEIARQKYRDDEYEFDMVEECIKNYQDYSVYYEADGWEPQAVETTFSKVFYEDERNKILLEGRMDLIVKSRDNQIFPVDHKTSDKKAFPSLLSNQFMAYAWATESFNVIHNEVGFQKTYGPAQRFHRNVLSYDPTLIKEWRENIIFDALRLISYIEQGYFPKNYASCKYCKYKRICETTPDAREFKISSLYHVGEAYDLFAKKS